MTSAPAIGFEYRPSRVPERLLALVAMLALVAIGLCGASVGLKLGLMAGTLAAAVAAARRSRYSSVAGVGYGPDGWSAYRTDRAQLPATLASFRVIGSCVLLRLRTGGSIETLLLAPDNSDADLRRRLRMRLAAQPPDAGAP